VYTGQEGQVRNLILERIRAEGFEDRIEEVLLPEEQVIEVVRGKRRSARKRIFPGYLLIKMTLDEETLAFLRRIGKVGGVVGESNRPVALSDEEVARIRQRMEAGEAQPRMEIRYEVGDVVRITEGPFANFSGTVQELLSDRGRVRVLVTIFGRGVPVDVELTQVEKV
jgi:transcriptional antiterminator NusG